MSGNAAIVGNLRVVLGLDSAQFESGMKRQAANANAGASAISKGVKAGLRDVESTFAGAAGQAGVFGSALTAMGLAGAAAGAGLVGTFAAVRSALAFGDEIGDTANKLAVTTDALQEYRYAVHQLGGEYADADDALQGFAVAFGAAHAQLSKKAAKPFEALGLDPKSFDSTEDALDAVIKKIAGLKSTAEQAAIADKLGLTAMLPAIRAGINEMDRLRDKAHDVGYVMDADLISRAGEANDKFEDLQQIVGVQLKSAFVDLAPILLNLTGLIGDMAKGLRGVVDQLASVENKTSDGLDARALTVSKELLILKHQQLQGGGASQVAIDSKIAELNQIEEERQRRKAASAAAANPKPEGLSLLPPLGNNKGQVRAASAAAVEAATKAELDARMALTENIEEVAALKAAQIQQETAAANAKLREDAADGKITAAAAQTAVTLNLRAQTEKLALVDRQKEADLAAQAVDREAEIDRYRQRIASVQAQFATSAAERSRIELDALASQQKVERDQLRLRLEAQVKSGLITAEYAKQQQLELGLTQIAETLKAKREGQVAVAREMEQEEQAELSLQVDLAQAQASLASTVIARRQAELKLLALQKEQERRDLSRRTVLNGYSEQEEQEARDRLSQLDVLYGSQEEIIRRQNSLAQAFREASDNVRDLASAVRSGDWPALFEGLEQTLRELQAAFSAQGTFADKLTTISGMVGGVGQVVGGKAGRGIASGAAVAGLGAWAGGALADATIGAAFSGAIGGTLANLGLGLAGVLGPIGIIAGVGIALSSLLGGKPSNHSGAADLTATSYSLVPNEKSTDKTLAGVQAAADAVLKGEALLQSLGLKLGSTVTNIDIGQRDKSNIKLSNGTSFRTSSVGDPAEAADAALRAVLKDATFVDDAQKKLVESMLAAGKGFDDISQALSDYKAAQQISQQIGDAIQQVVDPKGYDLKGVETAIQAQRDAAKAAADAGYLTADQLAAINAQLDTLRGLQLDQVMKRYTSAVDEAAQAAIDKAQSDLKSAFDAQVSAAQASVSQFSSIAESLQQYADSLKLQVARSPQDALASAKAAFDALVGKTDSASLSKLQSAGQSLLDAAKSGARDQFELARVQAQVRAATQAGAAAAQQQVDVAQAQLDRLTSLGQQLGLVNASVLSLPAALAALINSKLAAGQTVTIADASGKVIFDAATGVGTDAFGRPMPNVAKALGFATAGGFKVGGVGPADSKLAQLALTPNEYVNVTRGDSMAAMAASMADLHAAVASQGGAVHKTARALDDLHVLLRRLSRDGDALVTRAA